MFNLSETKSRSANVLFDSGNQRTYITEALREELNIPVIRKEKTIIQGFSQNNEVPEFLNVVSVKTRCLDNSFIKIEAICKPFITAPLVNQNILFAVERFDQLLRSLS